MFDLKKVIFGILLFSLFITVSGCAKKVEKERERAVIGSSAPDFTFSDLNGQKMSLSDHKGKVILLDFWATWCPPCRDSIPHLETLYQKYKERGFVVIGVSFDESVDRVKNFRDAYNMSYPILMAEDWIKNDYGITGVPEMFVIDRNGILKSHRLGFNESLAAILDEEVRSLL